jgi:hypothetical protein
MASCGRLLIGLLTMKQNLKEAGCAPFEIRHSLESGQESRYRDLVGQTPWSAAGPLAGFSRWSAKPDEDVGREPVLPPDLHAPHSYVSQGCPH